MLDGLIILLVAFGSFGLGRLSEIQKNKASNLPESVLLASPAKSQNFQNNNVLSELKPLQEGGKVVASKNGSKYHFPWCSGASQIAEKNKIWFDSETEARKAGYLPASNCKGLE